MAFKVKVLDLFSGIGGFSLGLERAGMKTVAFCEIEEFPRKVLNKHWPEVPIYDDIRKLTAERLTADGIGSVELICGGFPCQPFSVAGKREGKEDDRHLWPEYFRLIQAVKPRWVIGENVTGLIDLGLDEVLSDLESEGYSAETVVIPACAINAPHRRDRLWIIANANGRRWDNGARGQPHAGESYRSGGSEFRVRDDTTANLCSLKRTSPKWDNEPGMERILNGVPNRLDRLKGLGNAVVPQIPEIIGRAIMEIEASTDQA